MNKKYEIFEITKEISRVIAIDIKEEMIEELKPTGDVETIGYDVINENTNKREFHADDFISCIEFIKENDKQGWENKLYE